LSGYIGFAIYERNEIKLIDSLEVTELRDQIGSPEMRAIKNNHLKHTIRRAADTKSYWPILRLIKIVLQFLKCASSSSTVLSMVQGITNPAHLRLFVDLIDSGPPHVKQLSLSVIESLVMLNIPTEILEEATGGDFITWLQ
jgi:hypothetical protein